MFLDRAVRDGSGLQLRSWAPQRTHQPGHSSNSAWC